MIPLLFLLSCSHRGVRKDFLSYLPDQKKSERCPSLKKEAFARKEEGDYWNKVGVCRFLSGDLNQALFYFDMSLKKSDIESSAAALNNLGVLHLHQKRYRRAYSFFNKALERNSENVTINLNIAHLYMKFQRYASAKKILKKIAAKHGENKAVKRSLATIKKTGSK